MLPSDDDFDDAGTGRDTDEGLDDDVFSFVISELRVSSAKPASPSVSCFPSEESQLYPHWLASVQPPPPPPSVACSLSQHSASPFKAQLASVPAPPASRSDRK